MLTLVQDMNVSLKQFSFWGTFYFIRMVGAPGSDSGVPEAWHLCKCCHKWVTPGHLQSQQHARSMERWMREKNYVPNPHVLECIPAMYFGSLIDGLKELGLEVMARRYEEAWAIAHPPKLGIAHSPSYWFLKQNTNPYTIPT